MRKTLLLSLLCVFISIMRSESANVLLLTPIGSQSHKIFYMGIVNALAERGHSVTILSAYKNSKDIKNVRDVAIPELDVMGILTNVFEEGGADNLVKNLILDSPRICNDALSLKGVQDLKKEKYDIILMSVFFDYCFFSFVHHFKVPFVFISSGGLAGPFSGMSGSIEFPSIVANKLLEASFPLTFNQRLLTLTLNTFFGMVFPYYIYTKSEEICRQEGLCPPDMPSFNEYNENASLVIVNSVRGLEIPPRPALPTIIHAGGAHIKPGKPLANELEVWIKGAGEHGFIFFSLGSALKPSDMPEKNRKTFVNVFRTLPQRVLWKWNEDKMPDLPSNVKLSKWLPQQDILAHKQIKLFITHGGLLGTMEATYNGVPCLGMPVYADQFSNMKEAASEGWARVLLWKDLTEESLKAVITEIISNNSLKERAIKSASIMKDVPILPADEAAFWVEFVLRHGGASHLKSPVFQMSWYELHNVDVWATIFLIIFLIIIIVYYIIKALLRLCFGKKKTNSKGKSKHKKE